MRRALPLLLLVFAPVVWAGEGRFASWTTVGVDATFSRAVLGADADLLLAQRLRWRSEGEGPVHVQVLADGRFRLDVVQQPLVERAFVSSLGVVLDGSGWTLRLGRLPVSHGGALLFDGAEMLWHPNPTWDLGAWGGASPDRFTGRPEARFGGGPVLAVTGTRAGASLVGEVLWAAGGLDRASVLALASADAAPGTGISGRLDVQITDAAGRFGLADGALFGRWRPVRGLDLSVMYDAYGAERYLTTQDRDPALSRFAARADAAGVTTDNPQDILDPTVSQLTGAEVRWRPPGDGPRASVVERYRYHVDPTRRYFRVTPSAGVLLAAQRLDLGVDGNLLWIGQKWRGDAGITVYAEVTTQRTLALDGSFRVLLDQSAFSGRRGWEADLFLDWVTRPGWMLSGGFQWSYEPWNDFPDVGYRAYLALTKRGGGRPRDSRSASAPGSPPSPGTP